MYAKKSLGQHFLRSSHYIQMIADAGEVTSKDTVVEIGPGEGILTQELLSRGATVIAIEKDTRLIPLITEKFSQEIKKKKLHVFEEDVTTFTIPKIFLPKKYKVIANIPYYITGILIRKFLTTTQQPSCIVFLIQKEVAERIARSKKESILSLSVKAYGNPSIVKKVPAGAFVPPPKVESAILKIDHISRNIFLDKKHEQLFFELLHIGFGQKRKILKKNLESGLGKNLDIVFEKIHIPLHARAEDISLEQWVSLAKACLPLQTL